jgi:hypothetical protein
VGQYRTWDLYLTARNELQAMRTARWQVTVIEPQGLGTAERAWNSSNYLHDGYVMGGAQEQLSAQTQTPGQQGCIFQWRAVGQTEWNSSPPIAYDNPFLDFFWASWVWDTSALAPATQYELRTVNVNASGQLDPDPPTIRVWTDGLAGMATGLDAPQVVMAGQHLQADLAALNQGGRTWTAQDGPSVSLSAGSAFSMASDGTLEPWMQVPPGSQGTYLLDLIAPTAPGLHTLSLELKDGATALGPPVAVTIRVLNASVASTEQLRSYLLGQWTPPAGWEAQADLNADGQVDAGDLVSSILVQE